MLKIKNMVYIFLANGFEEIEGLGTMDILRRGGVNVTTVSITDSNEVETSHGVTIKTDALFANVNFSDAEMLVLPGGMPGSTNLNAHEGLRQLLLDFNAKGGKIAAICAAPLVFGSLGLLAGKRATIYPDMEKMLAGATYTAELVTVDGNITTGRGPAATFPFAYNLLEQLKGVDCAEQVSKGMVFTQLIHDMKR